MFWAASRHGSLPVFLPLLISQERLRMLDELADLLDTAIYGEIEFKAAL